MMRVRNHGGSCCGIKHIHGFPYSPTEKVAALPVRSVCQGANAEMTAGSEFYPGPRPMETGQERLKVLLEYIDAQKDSHLVEVALTDYTVSFWKTELESHGFRKVSVFTNSNTGRTVCVFHRITEDGEVMKPTKKEK